MLELLLPLVDGRAASCSPPRVATDGGRGSPPRWQRRGATVLQATPSTWRLLLDAGWPAGPGCGRCAGGEALPAELAQPLLARGVELWNMYGPTETTIWSSVARVRPGPVPLGEPIANTRCTSSTRTAAWCRWACPASCTSAAPAWPAATSAGPS